MGVWACAGLAEIISVQIATEAKQRELLLGRMGSSEWIVSEMKLSGNPALREGRVVRQVISLRVFAGLKRWLRLTRPWVRWLFCASL